MRYVIGLAALSAVATSAQAQVTITSVQRSVGVNSCVFAPPTYPNWCEHDGGSNATTGPWTKAVGFGNSAAGGDGYGASLTQASQESLATPNLIWVTGIARAEVESTGTCGGTGTASTSFAVTFKLHSAARAILTGDTSVSTGAEFLLSLQQLDGGFGYIHSGNHAADMPLEAGEYRYLTVASAGGSCSGACTHREQFNWESQLRFEPLECPADFNGDGLVEDSDFVAFVVAYTELLCPESPAACPCDLNSDGLVDDTDFVFFVGAYDALLCP